ncbi:hypothetical protein [Glutamicibacter uratoxydans]|uniref:hypothetical protein n=1 Tax=Glutamicibacter uratoxydans TaxID=43667 RepID=UPI0011416543|nr:hypothetical protein [Glutamicibacter uratoxydans]
MAFRKNRDQAGYPFELDTRSSDNLMSAQQKRRHASARKSLSWISFLILAVSACSLAGCSKGALNGDIKPGAGAYSVYYTDMDTNHGNATTVNDDGSTVATGKLKATNLSTRIDAPSTVGLLGARSADLVFVNTDGSVDTGFLDYPEGTGVTASTWLRSDEVASLVNVGQKEAGYSNPLVIHDRMGKTIRSLQLYGYMQSAIMDNGKLYLAGEISSSNPKESGSRVIVADPVEMKVLDQHDWAGTGGIQSCAAAEGLLYCLESDSFIGIEYPEFSWNKLVKIDPRTWKKTLIREFKDVGVRVVNLNGKVYALLEHRVVMLSPDGTKVASEQHFGSGEDAKVERLAAAPNGELDLYVRDFSFAARSEHRSYVGDILRIDPSSLATLRSTPMELPGEQFVDLHAIPAEFFSLAK